MHGVQMTYNVTQAVLIDAGTNASSDGTSSGDVLLWSLIDGFLFVTILTGNILTVVAVLRSRRLSKAVSNQFILSLSVSDLLVGVMLPYHMLFYILPDMAADFGYCIARLVLVSLACIASVLNIIAIAVDRFVAIVYPLHYGRYMTKKLARSMLFVCWMAAFGVATGPVYWNQWSNSNPPDKCELGYVVDSQYVWVIYVPAFLVLFTFMCGFWVRIIAEAIRHAKRLRKSSDPPDTWKSLQVLMLVMGSFTVSYLPFIILVILSSHFELRNSSTTLAYRITISLAMANSAVNPLIYSWKNREFKRVFSNLLRCRDVNLLDDEQSIHHRSRSSKNGPGIGQDIYTLETLSNNNKAGLVSDERLCTNGVSLPPIPHPTPPSPVNQ